MLKCTLFKNRWEGRRKIGREEKKRERGREGGGREKRRKGEEKQKKNNEHVSQHTYINILSKLRSIILSHNPYAQSFIQKNFSAFLSVEEDTHLVCHLLVRACSSQSHEAEGSSRLRLHFDHEESTCPDIMYERGWM